MSAPLNGHVPASAIGAEDTELLRYKQSLAAAGIGIWSVDLATYEVVWDARCRELFGLPPSNDAPIAYAEAVQNIHPDDRARVDAAVQAALAGENGGRYDEQYRTVGPDGNTRHVRFTGQAGFHEDGKATCFSGVAQDVTTWTTIQQKAEATERVAQTALESTGTGWFRVEMPSGVFEHSPELARIMTGDPTKIFSRESLTEFIHPDDRGVRLSAYAEAEKTDSLDYTIRFIWGDGSIHWVRVTGRYHRDVDGAIHLFTGTAQDVTDSRQTEAALRQSEHRFRSIFNGQFLFLAILAPDGTVADINDLPLKAIGVRRHQVLGKLFWETAWWSQLPEMRASWPRRLAEAARAQGPVFSEDRFQTTGGEVRTADAAITAVRNAAGAVEFFIVQASDITERKAAEEALRESEDRYQSFVRQSTDGIWRFEIDEPIPVTLPVEEQIDRIFSGAILAECNDAFARMYGYERSEELTGAQIRDFMPRDESAEAYMRHFIESGYRIAGLESREVDRYGRELYLMNNLIGIVEDGKVRRAWGTQRDITEERRRAHALEESEGRFRALIEQAPVATCLFVGRELRIEVANSAMVAVMGKGPDVVGKPLLEAVPELADQPFPQILATVFDTGETFEAKSKPATLIMHGEERHFYFDYIFKPLRNADGEVWAIIDMTVDVTAAVEARRAVEENEQKLRSLVEGAPFPIGLYVGREMRIQLANRSIIKTWGKGSDVVGKTYQEVLPELEGTGIYQQLEGVYDTGKPFHAKNQRVDLVVNGELRSQFFNYSFTPVLDADGKVYGVMNTAANVTDIALARQRAEEAETTLRGAIELAELGTWSLDVPSGVVTYSPRVQEWFGFDGEGTTHDAVYNPIHPRDRERVAAAIAAALDPAGSGLYNEEYTVVAQDTGRERVLHAQGKTYFDTNGTPLRLSGAVQDITRQRALQAELERQVAARTTELAEANRALTRSNEELSQYAYVASHDLQEPLRKIQMFSNLLDKADDFPAAARPTLSRITGAAARMSTLIQSLLEFSRLLNSDAMLRPVDLGETLSDIVQDFELTILEKRASVHIGPLPVVEAVALQMNQLFYNLLGNALKFSKPDEAPVIRVGATAAAPDLVRTHVSNARTGSAYQHITMADNGIGFETRYADQIFEVFKRLHTRDVYPGSGIGLALCRRIVENHGGALWAHSQPGVGTTFNILLPVYSSTDGG